MIKIEGIINPATKSVVFSQCELAYNKASKRHCSTPTVSFDNAVCRPTHTGQSIKIIMLGVSSSPLLGVVALGNGTTITREPRLDQGTA
jgi:hypothetical protein